MILIKGLWLGFCPYITIAGALGLFVSIMNNFIIMHIKGTKNEDYRFSVKFAASFIRLSLAWVLFYFLAFAPNTFSIPHFIGGIKIW